jgi:copper chaperone CopZ
MPFCPAVFATKIASDIKNFVSKIKGVKSVQVILKNHFMADEINKEINK